MRFNRPKQGQPYGGHQKATQRHRHQLNSLVHLLREVQREPLCHHAPEALPDDRRLLVDPSLHPATRGKAAHGPGTPRTMPTPRKSNQLTGTSPERAIGQAVTTNKRRAFRAPSGNGHTRDDPPAPDVSRPSVGLTAPSTKNQKRSKRGTTTKDLEILPRLRASGDRPSRGRIVTSRV